MNKKEGYYFRIKVSSEKVGAREIDVFVPTEKIGRFFEALAKRGKLKEAKSIEEETAKERVLEPETESSDSS